MLAQASQLDGTLLILTDAYTAETSIAACSPGSRSSNNTQQRQQQQHTMQLECLALAQRSKQAVQTMLHATTHTRALFVTWLQNAAALRSHSIPDPITRADTQILDSDACVGRDTRFRSYEPSIPCQNYGLSGTDPYTQQHGTSTPGISPMLIKRSQVEQALVATSQTADDTPENTDVDQDSIQGYQHAASTHVVSQDALTTHRSSVVDKYSVSNHSNGATDTENPASSDKDKVNKENTTTKADSIKTTSLDIEAPQPCIDDAALLLSDDSQDSAKMTQLEHLSHILSRMPQNLTVTFTVPIALTANQLSTAASRSLSVRHSQLTAFIPLCHCYILLFMYR